MMGDQPQDAGASGLSPVLEALLARVETLNQLETIPERIALLEQCLALVSRANSPLLWADLHVKLGDALQQGRGGDPRSQFTRSVTCYDVALSVYTRELAPFNWALTHEKKANVLRDLGRSLNGAARTAMLREAVLCYNTVLTVYDPEEVPNDWARAQNSKGRILRELARELTGGRKVQALRGSLACFDVALTLYTPAESPEGWATLHYNKMVVFSVLTDELHGTARMEALRATITSCDAVLTVYTREGNQADWVITQNNKGHASRDLAEMIGGRERVELLQTAIACYDQVLTVYTRQQVPEKWATAQNNKGIALRRLADSFAAKERLAALLAAIACYDAALLERRKEVAPLRWATTQSNKSQALSDQARLFSGTRQIETFRKALLCCDQALEVGTREGAPRIWALVEHNKGNVLRDLADLLRGEERVEALRTAVSCYDQALLEYRRKTAPTDWARAQHNKGNALVDLAEELERESQIQALREAIACYGNALLEYQRDTMPTYWAATQQNKAVALSDLANVLEGRERAEKLREAIACYEAALLEWQRDVVPGDWAMAQNNKGNALCDLASSLDGAERLETLAAAIACYDEALTVYRREVLPELHRHIAQKVGKLLFAEGQWARAAHYLATAFDALDDLFTLEVTARGRQSTLRTNSDLPAHLAYASLRTGAADALWQAAEVLERGRARTTGEAMARQEAQLAAAEQLAPNLLAAFREVSDQLVTLALRGSSEATPVGSGRETRTVLERQLAGYEEAREARERYEIVLTHIREILPNFLRDSTMLERSIEELKPDERLTYVVSTPVGGAIVLVSAVGDEAGKPVVRGWWDEQLTDAQVASWLEGATREDGAREKKLGGLLLEQYNAGSMREALGRVMRDLGVSAGVLAHLAAFCRAAHLRKLIIVPCGLLGLLPLHAALVQLDSAGAEHVPLLDIVQVSYAPSAHIWAACRRRVKAYPAEVLRALIVSDPQPQEPEVRALPGAKDEARAVSEIVRKCAHGEVSIFEGEDATLPGVIRALQRQAAALTHVHFACHGRTELTNPQTSGLLLAYGSRLTTRHLHDPAVVHFERLRLAVLSACRTALPGTDLPDEVIGLPSSWVQAGAMGVLASLWPVSDSKAAALMTKFYELHLLDQLEPAEALWLAQRWLRDLPTWREDCRAAGALSAAEGPEASETVRELDLIRGENAVLDVEATEENVVTIDESIMRIPQSHETDQIPSATGQRQFWEHARHWTAFVIYGA